MRIKTRFYLVVSFTVFLCVACTIAADYAIFRRGLAGAIAERSPLLFIYLLILAGGVLFAALLAHTVLPRLEKGARFAESVVSGTSSGKLNTGHDELGVMFQAFNVMIDQLNSAKTTITRLEREAMTASHQLTMQNARLEILIAARTQELQQAHRHMLDLSPTAMIIIRDGEVRQLNEKGTTLFGLREGDQVSKVFTDAEKYEEMLSLIERGRMAMEFPVKMSGADGKPLDVLFTLHPFIYEGLPSQLGWISGVTCGDTAIAKTGAEETEDSGHEHTPT